MYMLLLGKNTARSGVEPRFKWYFLKKLKNILF
jgi:hypothetical protein